VEIGYARTSRTDQRLDLQINALREYGVEDKFIHSEQLSALSVKRPQFELALKRCRAGDTLIVWKLDRLGRSVHQLIETVNGLSDRGVDFKSLTEPFDTTTPMGRMVFHMMAALAQMERDLTAERTREGIKAAKERKTYKTRGLTFTKEQWETMCAEYKEDSTKGPRPLADAAGVSYGTAYRYFDAIKQGIEFAARFPWEK